MVAVAIAKERTPAGLRALARRERDGRVSARLLALANALDGMSRGEAARAAGMDRQTLRDWVHRHDAEGIEGLRGRRRPGPRPRLTPAQEAELAAAVERGPEGRRGPLAAGGPRGADRGPLRGPPARALGRRGAAPARPRPPVGAPRRRTRRRRRRSKRLRRAGAGGAARARPRRAGRGLVPDAMGADTARADWP